MKYKILFEPSRFELHTIFASIILYKNMTLCETCPAPCCKSPIITWPNSGTEQVIEWIVSEEGNFKKWQNIEKFIEIFQKRLMKACEFDSFFHATNNPQRKLIVDTIECEISKEDNSLLFLFRVLFLCPEFTNGMCQNYMDRPEVCMNFLCQDAWGEHASREEISRKKEMSSPYQFWNIEDTLSWVREQIMSL